jgi:restriction system protein
LYASKWPEGFPLHYRVAWDAAERTLIIDGELPGPDIVPAVERYRYMKAEDREMEIERPAGERKGIYRRLVAQWMLRVLSDVFRADQQQDVAAIVLNGFVYGADPATGKDGEFYLATVMARRDAFTALDLARADPVACLEGLKGQLSPRPHKLTPVRPFLRVARGSAGVITEPQPAGDLMDWDPIDFEDLVAALFEQLGWDVMTTQRSGDGGVDVRAVDRDPVTGGKLVIQVKRYRHTIPPAHVRDLYGTVLHEGASLGILVTTSGFGPGAHEFAKDKPLRLISGPELADLLARHGLIDQKPPEPVRQAGSSGPPPYDSYSPAQFP